MLKRINNILLLLLAAATGFGQSLQRYEYWMDSEYSKHTTVRTSETDIKFDVDLSRVDKGVHYLNFRAQNSDKVWGSPQRYLFFVPDVPTTAPKVSSYEYWLDGEANKRTVVRQSAEDIALTIDISKLDIGVHYFNFRSINTDGSISSLNRYLFFIPQPQGGDITLNQYEYWIDEGKAIRKSVSGYDIDEAISMDISSLKPGVHYFNFRANTTDGVWGNLSRYLFYIPEYDNTSDAAVRYEYWLDGDFSKKQAQKVNGSEIPLTVDVSQLEKGLHYFNFRGQNVKGEWGGLSRWVFFLPYEDEKTSEVANYQYWIDDAYSEKKTTKATAEDVMLAVDVSSLKGSHIFNFRVQNGNGAWGSIFRYVFFVPEASEVEAKVANYQYWIDNELNSIRTVEAAAENVDLSVDVSHLKGIHYLNFRAQNTDGVWGCLSRYLFYVSDVSADSTSVSNVEYWFDDSQRTIKAVNGNDISLTLDISQLSHGMHEFHFRIQSTDGVWGTMHQHVFFLTDDSGSEDGGMTQYQYWVDDDLGTQQTVNADGLDVVLDMDVSSMKGIHYLNFRGQSKNGEWGPLARYLFYVPTETAEEDQLLTGYRYAFNGQTTCTGIAACKDYELSAFTIPIPDLTEIGSLTDGCSWQFSGSEARLIRNQKVSFALQFQNRTGDWSKPATSEFNLNDEQTRELGELNLKRQLTIDKVAPGDFQAFRMTIDTGRNYFLGASQPCNVMFFNASGNLVTTIDGDKLASVYQTSFASGTYYGVVYNMQTDSVNADKQVTLRLSLTEKMVPTPKITWQDETIAISCEQDDAAIYYTMDGSDPTPQSNRYIAPFPLKQNGTVKAIAVEAGSEATSYTAELTVDSYQVEMPTVEFADLKVYISCATPEAKIYYTLDGTIPTEKSLLYTEPFSQQSNCTVRVIAKRNGYNDSKDTTFNIDVTNLTCTPARFSSNNREVSITTLTSDAQIYYTLDGTVPTTQSLLYSEPVRPTLNGTIRAIVVRSGYVNSEVTEFTVDWLKAEKPTFSFADGQLTINCTTEGTTIYYTIGGDIPTEQSSVYTSALMLADNAMVKAIAIADRLNASDVAEYMPNKCVTPILSREGDVVAVKNGTQGATVYFTVDGTRPTGSSQQVENGLIVPTHNGTITAIALKDDALDSETVTFTVDWLKADTPVLSFSDGRLTMSCNTPGATIYYVIGEGTPLLSYTQPIMLTDNRTVTAVAKAQNLLDSEIATYNPNTFTCESVTVSFNGRDLQLSCATDGASIRYTMDGTQPGSNSPLYTGSLTISDLVTVKAIAMKPNTNSSPLSTFVVPAFYDGKRAVAGTAGQLSLAFGWCTPTEIEELVVEGSLDDTDLATLRAMSRLRHLNLSQVKMSGNRLPERAFQGMSLVSIAVPENMVSAGGNLFEGCQQLAAITWLVDFRLTAQMLQGVDNPNLLVYVKLQSDAPTSVSNVVVNGHANSITLVDRSEGNSNFYCPTAFTADRISYTHSYQQLTGIGECRGWETLALPFTVQTISHHSQGLLAPFAKGDSEARPFWLCRLSTGGFERADQIEANTPYIISMPNNQSYADQYILGGQVTFEAQNAQVHASTELTTDEKGDFWFVPCFTIQEKTSSILPINVGQAFDGFPEGSNFFRDLERNVRPFEAYVLSQSSAARRFSISEETTGITELQPENAGQLHVYDLRGHLVDKISSLDKLKRSHHLRPGIYIVRDAGGSQQKVQLK